MTSLSLYSSVPSFRICHGIVTEHTVCQAYLVSETLLDIEILAVPRWCIRTWTRSAAEMYGAAYVWISLQTRMRQTLACLNATAAAILPGAPMIRRPDEC
jgi:hypothetical protein